MVETGNVVGVARGRFRRFRRVMRQLFHEIVGALFAVLALAWLNAALRASQHDISRWLIAAAVAVAVIMAVFSWTSFRSARRLREADIDLQVPGNQ
jgi:predicted benzoate:H+ symporter BenE